MVAGSVNDEITLVIRLLDFDVAILQEIARNAGDAIMAVYDDNLKVEYKEDKSPLTVADKASHAVIVAGLQKNWPDVPILSEEGLTTPYAERKDWQCFWLVDPLDGTKEFIKRNGEFTVNIALIKSGQPAIGIVYAPALNRLYSGKKNSGAWVQYGIEDPIPIKASGVMSDEGLTVVMSRSHPSPELEAYLKDIRVKEALPIGSSLKLCVVAEGKADLYPRLGPTMEWDTAAGHAVVEAAGGIVQTPEGQYLLYNKENLLNPFFIVKSACFQN
ncbi:MAG: 3'(2'),5'-bisphosphate nucleotidase CysQ [Desulfuromusa sp.]|nr:3'(2'),5'-bisphosphate nucleotidase CysQ [Desulfuromusa sp.]